MKTESQNTYHIVRRMGKQRTYPPREFNQPGVEKCTTGSTKKCTTGSTTSLGKHSDGNHSQGDLPAGPSRVAPTKKKEKDKRQKFSREDYKEVMYAFYMSLEKPSGSHIENTFSIWRSRIHNVRMNVNGNILANVRRDIMNNQRLTDVELREIKEKVIADVKDIDSGNVGIKEWDVDDRDEGTGSTSCTDADTRVARTRYVDQRENVNHTGTLDDISTDEEPGDEFELVGEGSYNVSYHTTRNSIIMSHPSVNENSKTNSDPEKRKSDQTGKENNNIEYTLLRNEIIESIEKTEAIGMSERET